MNPLYPVESWFAAVWEFLVLRVPPIVRPFKAMYRKVMGRK